MRYRRISQPLRWAAATLDETLRIVVFSGGALDIDQTTRFVEFLDDYAIAVHRHVTMRCVLPRNHTSRSSGGRDS